ncbi:MAG: hypothetical protein AB7F86_12415 [Bdellovibrionales bacterium]
MRSFVGALLLFCWSYSILAAEVVKVKGKSALVELKGEPASPGDLFYLIAPDGKRRGIFKVSKKKGDKAIGKIMKGKAQPGFTLEYRSPKGSAKGPKLSKPSMDDGSAQAVLGTTRSYWGALLGYSSDTMSVKVTNVSNQDVGTASMSGSGFSAKGLFDYELFSSIWFRGAAGIEMFNAEGSKICGVSNNASCTAKLMYLTFDFLGRYVFSKGTFRPWIGGGLDLLFPASKDASALDPSSISTTNVIIAAAGLDWFMSPTFYIPISIEYGLLPKSDEVEASWIAFRAGFAVPF